MTKRSILNDKIIIFGVYWFNMSLGINYVQKIQ